jgi:VIT1/CCC1 family predicted Fe2+/Mn2+ transporter
MHTEGHRTDVIGWLRAALLGANDGLISTGSLIVGVAAADSGHREILVAGFAGLVAGAVSMAAGEYVSVSSQADAEQADLDRERRELAENPEAEHAELARIYESRGLPVELARQVADRLMAHDALGAHARDELGLLELTRARPLQAAAASAAAFAVGAIVPLALASAVPRDVLSPLVSAASILVLALMGALAARLGGAPSAAGAFRVAFWGAMAMVCTALVGRVFGARI